jgi:hypothetical protein
MREGHSPMPMARIVNQESNKISKQHSGFVTHCNNTQRPKRDQQRERERERERESADHRSPDTV